MNPSGPSEFQQQPSPAAEYFEEAKALFDAEEFPRSMKILMSGFKKDADYQPLYALAAETAGKLEEHRLQSLLEHTADNMQEASAFYELGEFFFEYDKYGLAEVFYDKTLRLDPDYPSAVHDLILSIARQFRADDALNAFNRITADNPDFWESYLLCKLCIFTERRSFMEKMEENWLTVLDTGIMARVKDPELKQDLMVKITELREALERYASFQEVQTNIRDWQFIQYGSAVLDVHHDGEKYLAGGRNGISFGTMETVRSMADRVKQFVQRLEIPIQQVAALDDRDSKIIGRLLAKVLDVPFYFYNRFAYIEHTLIVAGDSSYLTYHWYNDLSEIKNGQVVFALNHNWTRPTKITPDIIGQMAQQYRFPWDGGGMQFWADNDQEKVKVEVTPADNRSAEEIASEIFETQFLPVDMQDLLDFYAEKKPYLKGIGERSGSTRFEFNIESPVPGTLIE